MKAKWIAKRVCKTGWMVFEVITAVWEAMMQRTIDEIFSETSKRHWECAAWIALLLVACATPVRLSNASDQIPGSPQAGPIALVGATLYPIDQPPIQEGVLVFDQGKIIALGKKVKLPEGCEVIDCQGKHVYPSLIDAYSDIGLVEINSVRASVDSSEVGEFNPNVRSAAAFNPDSELSPVNRANGILLALTAPKGGRISGRSSLMMLDGWTWEDMTLQADVGMHIRWSSEPEALKTLEEIFDQARRYRLARASAADSDLTDPPLDLRLDSLTKVLDRSMPVVADADSIDQIRTAVAFAARNNIRLIIHGGADAARCADLLVEQQIPVIVSGVYRSPRRRHDAYDEAYVLPKQLEDAGVTFCISSGGMFGASGIRNLPYHAATAAAYGLSEAVALAAITRRSAEILGVADRVGTLKKGLDATVFVSDGNILETPTQVEIAFVQGRKVDLDNKHLQLYRKYKAKYGLE